MAKQTQASNDKWIAEAEKKYGKGTIQFLNSGAIVACESISTGAITLDIALGVGGIPKGRMVEIFGPESSGKTTLALGIVANCQKDGGVAAFIDAEHALDPDWAKRIGVNLDTLAISQPDNGEQALDIAEMMVKSGNVDLVVVDSAAALVPQAEIDGEMGDSHVGLQARLMSQACRKLAGALSKSKCTIIFINQIREKIGVMFGNPETTPGGRALKFYSSVRIDIRKTTAIKEGDTAVGNMVKAKVVKNKVAPPFRNADLKIYFGSPSKDGGNYCCGIDGASALIDQGLAMGLVEKSGSWLNYGTTRLGLGVAAAGSFLRANPEITKDMREKIMERIKVSKPAPAAPDSGFDEEEKADSGDAEPIPDEQ